MGTNQKKTPEGEPIPAGTRAESSLPPVLLPGIHSPADLKVLPEDKMPELCREIRGELLRTVTRTGGHLASNLGVVELSVAMHRVFDCPRDHFIFDVGHQSYVHKMLTGRYERMQTLRQGGGISGFTKRTESEYDCFGAGHSSTSLSAALGFAQADRMMGSDAWTVAVVGDGAFTGGMIHEALNNVGPGLRLVIIINENEMSISKNIGRFAMHMARLRQKEGYFRTKRRTTHFIKKIPLIGDGLFRAIRRVKKSFKNAMYGSNYFEDMGLYYLGPADGNDYRAVVNLLQAALNIEEDMDNLRYNKVVIATDADVDGMHIRLLLMTFFLQFFPDVIRGGHLYVLQTPLFRVRNKKETHYCYSEEEKNRAVARCGANAEITRFKGLGEISPDEFRGFIGQDIRLDKVRLTKDDPIHDMLEFYMGKNTYERQGFIIGNLRIEEDIVESDLAIG